VRTGPRRMFSAALTWVPRDPPETAAQTPVDPMRRSPTQPPVTAFIPPPKIFANFRLTLSG